jgi:hypothetical protein
MSHNEYCAELETLIVKVLLPGYLVYASEHKKSVPWERIPAHLAKVAGPDQPLAKLLTKF